MAELIEMSRAGVAGGLEATVLRLLKDAYGDYPADPAEGCRRIAGNLGRRGSVR